MEKWDAFFNKRLMEPFVPEPPVGEPNTACSSSLLLWRIANSKLNVPEATREVR